MKLKGYLVRESNNPSKFYFFECDTMLVRKHGEWVFPKNGKQGKILTFDFSLLHDMGLDLPSFTECYEYEIEFKKKDGELRET